MPELDMQVSAEVVLKYSLVRIGMFQISGHNWQKLIAQDPIIALRTCSWHYDPPNQDPLLTALDPLLVNQDPRLTGRDPLQTAWDPLAGQYLLITA